MVHGVEDGPAGVLVRRGGEHAALFVWEELGAAEVAVVDAVGEDGGFGGEALEVLLEGGLVVHDHGTEGWASLWPITSLSRALIISAASLPLPASRMPSTRALREVSIDICRLRTRLPTDRGTQSPARKAASTSVLTSFPILERLEIRKERPYLSPLVKNV